MKLPQRNIRGSAAGFTLMELLAVVLIILTLGALVVGIAGVARTKALNGHAKAEVTALELALESYKLDFGAYPTSTPVRVSHTGLMEGSNSWLMIQALTGSGRSYYQVPAGQTMKVTETMWVLTDPWRRPYNYYNYRPPPSSITITSLPPPPATATEVWSVGGQRNLVTFDLWSYGKDGRTWGGPGWPTSGGLGSHSSREYEEDDVANYR